MSSLEQAFIDVKTACAEGATHLGNDHTATQALGALIELR